jgi:hypothetical protein
MIKLTGNQKIALDLLTDITLPRGTNKTLTSGMASELITLICDLQSDSFELQDKLHRRNLLVDNLRREIRELKKQPTIKEYNQVINDCNDMRKSVKTIFYRCKCGHLREQGIVCMNNDCKED